MGIFIIRFDKKKLVYKVWGFFYVWFDIYDYLYVVVFLFICYKDLCLVFFNILWFILEYFFCWFIFFKERDYDLKKIVKIDLFLFLELKY